MLVDFVTVLRPISFLRRTDTCGCLSHHNKIRNIVLMLNYLVSKDEHILCTM